MCVHANWVNWNLRWPAFRDVTKKTNPKTANVSETSRVHSSAQVGERGKDPRSGSVIRTDNVEHKAYESVVGGQWQQYLIDQNNMLKVVYDALSVKKVHSGS